MDTPRPFRSAGALAKMSIRLLIRCIMKFSYVMVFLFLAAAGAAQQFDSRIQIGDPVTSPSFEGDSEDWSPDGQWIVANHATHEQPGPTQLSILLMPLSAAPKGATKPT